MSEIEGKRIGFASSKEKVPVCGKPVKFAFSDFALPACYIFQKWEIAEEIKTKYGISAIDLLQPDLTIAALEDNIEVVAVVAFTKVATFTVSPAGMAVSPTVDIEFPSNLADIEACRYNVTAFPASANNVCFEFAGFLDNGGDLIKPATDAPYEFLFEGDSTLTAFYKLRQYFTTHSITGFGKLNLVKIGENNPTLEQLDA